jgi:hypothetical protein
MSDAAMPWCSRGIPLLRMIVPAGKLISIPHGIISIETKVYAQYVWETGAVAMRIWPVKKQAIAATIIYATLILAKRHPTTRDARKPLIATGLD